MPRRLNMSQQLHVALMVAIAAMLLAPCAAAATSVEETSVPILGLLLLLVGAVTVLLVLILKLKLQAFLALLLTSVLTAIGAALINPAAAGIAEVGETIVDGMGSSLGFVATVIGIGSIFGALLESSGGTEILAKAALRLFGFDRASWAMLLTGFVISIPVFFDVALVILSPLLQALARDTKRSLIFFGLPLATGLATAHAFVPPTPGPVAVAYFLGVNLGYVILFGLIIGLPTAIICGPLLCTRVAAVVVKDSPENSAPEPSRISLELSQLESEVSTELESGGSEQTPTKPKQLPSASLIVCFIALPIVLILGNTLVEQVASSGIPAGLTSEARKAEVSKVLEGLPIWAQVLHLIGHPIIALILSTLLAVWALGTRLGSTREELNELATKALEPAGIIILITGAGGVFKQVLGASGIAEALTAVFANVQIPLVVIAWVFAALIRIAQGSATVAMLTAAGLMHGFIQTADPPLGQARLALVACAIASGSTGFSHVNDSGFWMISRYFGLTEKQSLQTWTVISTAISVVSFAIVLLLNLLVR